MSRFWVYAFGLWGFATYATTEPEKDHVQAALVHAPAFSEADIRASRVVTEAAENLPGKPAAIFIGVDMMNLFIVIEAGEHHVTIIDGGKLEPVHRFRSRVGLQGRPQFSPDGRYVYFASRDGWISKFDMWNLNVVAEIRAGLNAQSLVLSGDGKFLAVANVLPRTLVLMDGDLNLLKVHALRSRDGKKDSRISALVDASPRRSFVATLKDVPEVWEISYNPMAEDVPVGMIHDFRYREGAFIPGFLNPRRTALAEPLDDFVLVRDHSELIGTNRDTGKNQVVNLDVRKKIADLNPPGVPHWGAGISWRRQGKDVVAVPNLKDGVITLIDPATWKTIKSIRTSGPGLYVGSHENTPYVWADALMGKAGHTLMVIDKHMLEQVAEIRTDAGRTVTQVEFTRDGKFALASRSERKSDRGAIIVYDAVTLKEVKRIPMDEPVGTYNLSNQISRSHGASQ